MPANPPCLLSLDSWPNPKKKGEKKKKKEKEYMLFLNECRPAHWTTHGPPIKSMLSTATIVGKHQISLLTCAYVNDEIIGQI